MDPITAALCEQQMNETAIREVLRANPAAETFTPYVIWSRQSDSLTAYFDGAADYSEQITEAISVYRSLETREPVGFRLAGIGQVVDFCRSFLPSPIPLNVLLLGYWGSVRDHREILSDLARESKRRGLVLEA